MMKDRVSNWVLHFSKFVAMSCPVALFMCLPVGAQAVQADSKDGGSAQLLAQASTPQAAAQPAPAPKKLPIVKQPVAVSAAVLKEWAKTMHHTPAPKEGCFNALYPSTEWQAVPCAPAPGYRSVRPKSGKAKGGPEAVGGTGMGPLFTNDLVVQAPSGTIFKTVEGSFISVSGVTSETGVGVPAYGGGGALGANEYMLQVNTNGLESPNNSHTAACGSYSYCAPWVQFLFATNTFVSLTGTAKTNETEVYIEYWLLNYAVDVDGGVTSVCPSGFVDAGSDFTGPGDDCVQNTPANVVPWNPPTNLGQMPITDLADLAFSGTAIPGGNDQATVTFNGHGYSATVPDSLTDVSSVWKQAEFNVLGNDGGSQAQFNSGTTLAVQTAVTMTNGSMSAPTCVLNAGTTGESNNLNFATAPGTTTPPVCCPYGGATPGIQFVESNNPGEWARCPTPITWGDPHITTVDGTIYDFQGAGEYVALLDSDGTQVQVRQSPIAGDAPGNWVPASGAKFQNDGLISCLSSNTAVAARVGTHRVTYEPGFGVPNPSGLQLRIDGKVTTQGVNFGDGGSVETNSDGIEVHFPDGKILAVSGSLPYLSLDFSSIGVVSKSAGASESGLAGVVPTGNWLPKLASGASVGPMPASLHARYVTLNQTFGNAWRVTNSNSLFDYAPGTSTATFTNAAWPVENAKTCPVPNVKTTPHISAAAAEEACKSINDANLHSSCVFDVQATGITHLADTYAITERIHLKLAVKPLEIKAALPDIK